jgi:hypothetical protein
LSSLKLSTNETVFPKSKRGRPRKTTFGNVEMPTVREDRHQPKIGASLGPPGKSDIILSLNEDRYKHIMWEHFNNLGMIRDAKQEQDASDEAFKQFKQIMGNRGKFFKRSNANGSDFEVNDDVARESKF